MKKLSLLMIVIFAFEEINAQQLIPYITDFETSDTSWQATTTSGSSWQWGMPLTGNPTSAHSGSNCWDIALNNTYLNNTNTTLYSPTFNFTGVNIPKIFLNYFASCETSWDGSRLEYSADGGNTWGILTDSTIVIWNYYNSLLSSGLLAWTGFDSSWSFAFASIPFLGNEADVRFRFVFTSDASVTGDGFAIDDFGVIPDGTHFINSSIYFANPPCGAPQTATFNLMGFTGDTINTSGTATAHVFFGDGSDTIFTISYANNFYYKSFLHVYNLTGLYSTQYIITDQNNVSDTLIKPGQVFIDNNCGNISGQVYYDMNADCNFNSGDTAIMNAQIQLTMPNGSSYIIFTDASGNYNVNVPTGLSYTVKLLTSYNPSFNSVCPASGTYTISALPSIGNNFGIYCSPAFDLSAWLGGWSYVPGQQSTHYLSVLSNSCSVINATAYVVLPSSLAYVYAAPTPSQISNDTLIWNFNTNPANNITTFNFTVLTDTTVQIGDTICVNAFVEPISTDIFPLNNSTNVCRAASVSLDPNNKSVYPERAISVNQDLTYTINFQNTGTSQAYSIYLLDTLDINLDVTSLRIIGSSHTMTAQVLPGNVLHFSFNNIYLPDSNVNEPASHGYVMYAIKPLANTLPGSFIENTAAIYFDFNAPVLTNTTENFIAIPTATTNILPSVSIFELRPNPASEKITLISKSRNVNSAKIIVTDVTGNVILIANQVDQTISLDIQKLAKGFYTVVLEIEGVKFARKFVKE